jgi:para-nitrobenzyl esterase
MEQLVHSCWVGFAKTGKPACAGQEWPAFAPDDDQLLEFGMHTGLRKDFRKDQYRALEAVLVSNR